MCSVQCILCHREQSLCHALRYMYWEWRMLDERFPKSFESCMNHMKISQECLVISSLLVSCSHHHVARSVTTEDLSMLHGWKNTWSPWVKWNPSILTVKAKVNLNIAHMGHCNPGSCHQGTRPPRADHAHCRAVVPHLSHHMFGNGIGLVEKEKGTRGPRLFERRLTSPWFFRVEGKNGPCWDCGSSAEHLEFCWPRTWGPVAL